MIKVNCIGYDEETDEDLSYFWTGWIYLPDVEVIKSIDCFLDNKAFSGFENNNDDFWSSYKK